jgi:hypothetical protein
MGFGSVFAFKVGSQHSDILGGLTVLMALGLEGMKPLAIHTAFKALQSFNVIRGLLLASLGLVAVAYSMTAELSLMSLTKGDMIAERQATIDKERKAREAYDRAKLELDNLAFSRPVGVVVAEIQAVESLPGIMINDKPCGGIYDGRTTREYCPKLALLKAELARSERRNQLLAVLDADAAGSVENTPVVATADPGSTSLALYLGLLGITASVEVISQWLNLIPVLAIELGSALAAVLISSVESIGSSSTPEPETVEQEAVQEAVQPQDMGVAGGSLPRSKDEIEAVLVARMRKLGGSVSGSERSLAQQLGTSKATVRRAIESLRGGGIITAEAAKNGTCLTLL